MGIREEEYERIMKQQIPLFEKMDNGQKLAIWQGLNDGLTMEQIKVYAKPEYNGAQMDEIRWGFKRGLTIEQVSIYAKPEFNWEQMDEIREGFLDGLSIEQIKEYEKPEF